MGTRTLGALLLLLPLAAVCTQAGSASSAANDPPRIVLWHSIGSVTLRMPRGQVERVYGRPSYPGLGVEVPQYRVRGGVFFVRYGPCKAQGPRCRGRVIEVSTSSPRYRARSGLGVGARIPFPACRRGSSGRCVRKWRGWTLGEHPLTGVPVWWRWATYAGRPVTAFLDMRGAGPAPYRPVGTGVVFELGFIDRRVPASEWRW